jgi:ABC-type transporter Mla maintaining outer membrane lipid asymmetry ATPase subunit MlaF
LRTIRAKDNEDTIQVQDLSKSFDNRLVVRSLSFKAPDGQ